MKDPTLPQKMHQVRSRLAEVRQDLLESEARLGASGEEMPAADAIERLRSARLKLQEQLALLESLEAE